MIEQEARPSPQLRRDGSTRLKSNISGRFLDNHAYEGKDRRVMDKTAVLRQEPAKMEQSITEFIAKSLHIILESRCPYINSSRNYSSEQFLSSPSSSFRSRNWGFNLALRDCPVALQYMNSLRQSHLEPMIIDVILTNRPRDSKSEKIIERWILQYETKNNSSGKKKSSSISSHTVYKKSVLFLRSLYATLRLLPAYKLFRGLISSPHIQTYSLGHCLSTFVEPFTRSEEANMERFVFTPVDTSCGKICLSVMYCSAVLDVSSEPSTSNISPQFIPEYVGSPLAKPIKSFPSNTSSFGRRHSWSYKFYKASLCHDRGKTSGAKTSLNILPFRSFSRSPNRLSFKDDCDDSGPFDLDYDDRIDLPTRSRSFDQPRPQSAEHFPVRRKSQDAAVGALVQLLNKAQPLRKEEISCTPRSSEHASKIGSEPGVFPSSVLVSSKTTADALKELCEYSELKNFLLKQGKVSIT